MLIHDDAARVSWDEAAALFPLVGWNPRLPDELELAFTRSVARAFAVEGDVLVGFARAVGDGIYTMRASSTSSCILGINVLASVPNSSNTFRVVSPTPCYSP